MSSYVHVDNNKKRYFDSRWRPYTRIRGTTLTAKKHYSINFTENNNFVVAWIIMKKTVIFLLMVLKFKNLTQKILGL